MTKRRIGSGQRVFLAVVDESDEMRVALRYASLRAKAVNGKVAMLYVIEPSDFLQWMAVEHLAREERREEAETLLNDLSTNVQKWSGSMPILHVREGGRREELFKLIDEDPNISILVLAASTNPVGPGPLIQALTTRFVNQLKIPITIVPGDLSDEEIEAIA